MNERRIIPLAQVPESAQHFVQTCFYHTCPKHHREVKAVAAVKVEGLMEGCPALYFGICGNHAEVYPFTDEEARKHPMRCPHCFPR